MSPEAYLEMAKTESVHWWFCARRKILTALLEKLNLPKSARILEIGSGTGGNLEMLAKFGSVSAVEMDPTARALSMEKTLGNFDIRAGYCPNDLPFGGRTFDLICLFDVLEHIPDDGSTLDVLHSLLAADGRVILTVPAHRWLWGPHDEYLHHQRRYSATELKQKVLAANFRVVKFSYFNTLLFPLAAVIRLKERFAMAQQAKGGSVPPTPLNRLLESVFSLESFVLPRFNLPFGVSILAVLEPNRAQI